MARRATVGQRDLIDYAEAAHQGIEATLRDELAAYAIRETGQGELIRQLRGALMRAHGLLTETQGYLPKTQREGLAAFVLASRELLGR